MNIDRIWELLNKNVDVFWSNDNYKIYRSTLLRDNEFQANHFSTRNGEILSIRCISNYFGEVIDEKELDSLFIKPYKILDWHGSDCFEGMLFDTFDDAEAYLSEFLVDDYDTDRGEYEITQVDKREV